MNPITPEQLHILQHSLGLDEYGQGRMYRNFFCAGDDDAVICRSLVDLGLMKQHRTTEVYPDQNFSVTDEGKLVAREQSPKPPKLTRSQQRYRAFLKADLGCSFREWLDIEKGGPR